MDEQETTMAQEDFLPWVAQQLAQHTATIAALLGKAKAAEYALLMLIGQHPDRETLRTKWQQTSVELVDLEMRQTTFQNPSYRDGFQSMLASLSRAVQHKYEE